jgi:hypothetical protein
MIYSGYEYWQSAIGPLREPVLFCLGADREGSVGYFKVDPKFDIIQQYEDHIFRLSAFWTNTDGHWAQLALSAGRLLCGRVTEADSLIGAVSDAKGMDPHAKGRCILMPFRVCAAALPLPEALRDTRRWIAGSAEQAALRSWLAEHRDRLIWDRAAGVYRF